jgi:hypothetical protein
MQTHTLLSELPLQVCVARPRVWKSAGCRAAATEARRAVWQRRLGLEANRCRPAPADFVSKALDCEHTMRCGTAPQRTRRIDTHHIGHTSDVLPQRCQVALARNHNAIAPLRLVSMVTSPVRCRNAPCVMSQIFLCKTMQRETCSNASNRSSRWVIYEKTVLLPAPQSAHTKRAFVANDDRVALLDANSYMALK